MLWAETLLKLRCIMFGKGSFKAPSLLKLNLTNSKEKLLLITPFSKTTNSAYLKRYTQMI
jgi:hypothetical protein